MTGDRNTRDKLIALTQLVAQEGIEISAAFAALHGLHPTHLQALMLVMAAQDAGTLISAGALSEQLALTSGAITAALDRLERAGHLARVRDGSDRRKVLLRASPSGRALTEQYLLPSLQRSHDAMDQFTPAELEVAHRYLTVTSAAMGAYRRSLAPQPASTPETSAAPGREPTT